MVIGDNFTRFFNIFLTYTTQRQIDNWKAPINFDEKRRFKKMSQHLLYFFTYMDNISVIFSRNLWWCLFYTHLHEKNILY